MTRSDLAAPNLDWSLRQANQPAKRDIVLSVILDIIQWIEKNIDAELNVKIVTAKSGYTQWYFQRSFRRITGESLGEYLRFRRFVSAIDELILTEKSILAIALDYGFTSQQNFTRIFQIYMGATPGEFRKKSSPLASCRNKMIERFLSKHPFFMENLTLPFL